MGIFDRVRESTPADRHDRSTGATEAASDAGKRPGERGERSEGGSSLDNAQAATGGADAVPDTPDGVEENYT
jgi:hypothetical protein